MLRIKLFNLLLKASFIFFFITEFSFSHLPLCICTIPTPICPISSCLLCRSLALIFRYLQIPVLCISTASFLWKQPFSCFMYTVLAVNSKVTACLGVLLAFLSFFFSPKFQMGKFHLEGVLRSRVYLYSALR